MLIYYLKYAALVLTGTIYLSVLVMWHINYRASSMGARAMHLNSRIMMLEARMRTGNALINTIAGRNVFISNHAINASNAVRRRTVQLESLIEKAR